MARFLLKRVDSGRRSSDASAVIVEAETREAAIAKCRQRGAWKVAREVSEREAAEVRAGLLGVRRA